MIVTDSVLKVMLLAQAGQTNAVPLGLELSDEERSFIERFRPDKALLWAELPETLKLLQKLEVPCYRLTLQLPAAPAQVEQAIKDAEPIGERVAPDAVVRVVEDVLTFECGARKYEVGNSLPARATACG